MAATPSRPRSSRRWRRVFAGAAAAAIAVPALAATYDGPTPDDPGADTAHGVVALVDTGINPYHDVWADNSPRAFQHPSTYLDGYPADAIALDLTLDEDNYRRAVRDDCDVWSSIEPGQLYWVPGTRIVGAISFDPDPIELCDGASGILDMDGHGTMTASRATGAGYGACPDCLVVSVQGLTADSVGWAAEQAAWIDAQSNSWGPLPGVIGPELTTTIEQAARTHLTFFASGNGLMATAGVYGHPTYMQTELTPSVISVGGHDSGQVALWPDAPAHVVSDACDSWAADSQSTDASAEDIGGGTSGASPFVAGNAVRIAREARFLLGDSGGGVVDGVVASGVAPAGVTSGPLADGVFTLDEWREVLLKTATERPEAQAQDGPSCGPLAAPYSSLPVTWTEMPDDFPEYLYIGYGAVDEPAIQRAFAVLRGEQRLPDRSETDRFFELDAAARGALYEVYSLGG